MNFFDAKWCDKSHKAFDIKVEDKLYGIVPYTFILNSDIKSKIYLEIESLYNNGKLEIEEYDSSFDESDLIASIRSRRNSLLTETDKYMTIDYPISEDKKEMIKIYRQALRDIPFQKGFPHDVQWPEIPNIK